MKNDFGRSQTRFQYKKLKLGTIEVLETSSVMIDKT